MRVIITGATGFIGSRLCERLHKEYEVIALSRNSERARQSIGHMTKIIQWDAKTPARWKNEADGAHAIINLAGENLASGRWNSERKSRILQSRLDAINAVIETIKQMRNKPKLVILASAIGYYGPRDDEQLDETSLPGEGFLTNVCERIENSAEEIEALGVRCVVIRSGVVLGRDAGALPRLAKPFRFFLGGYLGSGKQWFSWISLEDELAAIKFLMESENISGVFNLTAPKPVTIKEFCVTLGRILKRPCWFKVPGFALRLALGEMADEMLLSGQKILPKRLLDAGFKFNNPDLEKTLRAIYN
jgi:uncharacterized protein (TIGR01777 family)